MQTVVLQPVGQKLQERVVECPILELAYLTRNIRKHPMFLDFGWINIKDRLCFPGSLRLTGDRASVSGFRPVRSPPANIFHEAPRRSIDSSVPHGTY
jgi:hypothetical protein